MRILSVFGTRPEAIKMAPVVAQLERDDRFESVVCVTSQHKEMLRPVLRLFDLRTDFDLDIMRPNQTLCDSTAHILSRVQGVIREAKPDLILVQGDTTTTFAVALAAFYAKVPTGHIEAGLRTFDKAAPFPEEINRQLVSRMADHHFVPTIRAREHLLREAIPEAAIHLTGNTAIDALFHALESHDADPVRLELPCQNASALREQLSDASRRLVLVTAHRRESFGAGLSGICRALLELSRRDDVFIVYPVHLNPNVREPVHEALGGRANIHLLRPVDYLPFVGLMRRSHLIITDSGGVQEEAPSLGKPVLVTRDKTERPEAIEAGTVRLVGTQSPRILDAAVELLGDPEAYRRMAVAHNPYGDGRAAERIVRVLAQQDPAAEHPKPNSGVGAAGSWRRRFLTPPPWPVIASRA